MTTECYRYTFGAALPIEEAEATLLLALFGVESLHGEAQTQLDAAHYFDADRRQCAIDATTVVGQCFNKLFVGYLRREFGADSFRVERLPAEDLTVAG